MKYRSFGKNKKRPIKIIRCHLAINWISQRSLNQRKFKNLLRETNGANQMKIIKKVTIFLSISMKIEKAIQLTMEVMSGKRSMMKIVCLIK